MLLMPCTASKTPPVRLCIEIRLPVHKFCHQEPITLREYIPYKNPYTNNRVEQALPTVWKPRHHRERAETGNSNGREKIPIPIPRYFKIPTPIPTFKNTAKIPHTDTDLKYHYRPSSNPEFLETG